MLILCALLLVYIPCVGLLQFLHLNEIHYELYIYKKRFPHKKKNHQGSKGRSGTHLFQVSDFPHLNAKYSVSFFVFSIGFDLCASCMECKKLYLVCIWALKLFIIFSLTIFSWCLKPYGVLGTMCLP